MAAKFEAACAALTEVEGEVHREIVEEVCREVKVFFEGLAGRRAGRLLEREVETRERMLEWGSRLLQGAIELWGTGYAGKRIACGCGGEQRFVEYRTRHLLTLVGPVKVTRAYYYCDSCGESGCPLDAVLGLRSRDESEGVQRSMGRLGAAMTFEEAAETLKEVGAIELCAKSFDWVTQDLGKELGKQSAEEQETLLTGEVEPEGEGVDRLYVTMDAAKVPTREQWRDMKVGAIYTTELVPNLKEQGAVRAEADRVSYVTGIETAEEFGKKVYAESVRRGLREGTEVICLGDGAVWIWNQADTHFPGSRQYIDWWHVTEWFWDVGKLLYGEGTEACTTWQEEAEALMWVGKVKETVAFLKNEQPRGKDKREALRKLIARLEENRERLPNYAALHQQGYHIGSGVVESACKHVVQQRLKRAGMRWKKENAEYVANVRTCIINGRWQKFWDQRYRCAA